MSEIWTVLQANLTDFMQANIVIFCLTLIMICLDIVTGLICAAFAGEYSSTKFREGLGHKFAYLMVMIAIAVVQVAMFDPQFTVNFDVPLFNVVCCLIIAMEFTSIVENAAKLNPHIKALLNGIDNRNEPDVIEDDEFEYKVD